MPNTKSAEKRVRSNARKAAHNKTIKSRLKSLEKKYLALYHMTSVDVSRSEPWAKAANTPWTEKMRPHFRDPLVLRCRKYVRRG